MEVPGLAGATFSPAAPRLPLATALRICDLYWYPATLSTSRAHRREQHAGFGLDVPDDRPEWAQLAVRGRRLCLEGCASTTLTALGAKGETTLIRVLVVESARLMRAALVSLLSLEAGVEVVAVVGRNDQAVPVATALHPDVTLIDVGSLGDDGPTVAARIHEQFPQCRTLLLTDTRQPETLRSLVATGYSLLLKDAPPARLVEGIKKIAAGERFMDPEVISATLNTAESPLTPRELEVLRLTAEGASVTEIAERLFLSIGTVRNYLSMGTSKIGARTRIDAIRIAKEAGWL